MRNPSRAHRAHRAAARAPLDYTSLIKQHHLSDLIEPFRGSVLI